MKYNVTVRYLGEGDGFERHQVFHGYHADTAWQAILQCMTKPEVARIRGNNLLGVDVKPVKLVKP